MKSKFSGLIILLQLFVSSIAFCQTFYPVVISNNGILIGNKQLSYFTDTTSVEDAKNIFALNGICVDRDKNLIKLEILEFRLTFYKNGKATSYNSTSNSLTKEMKEELTKLISESRITFENILAKFPNGESMHLALFDITII